MLLSSNFSPFFSNISTYISNLRSQISCSFVKFGCSVGICLNSANPICRSTDISKCFRGSLRLRDNESRLYYRIWLQLEPVLAVGAFHGYT